MDHKALERELVTGTEWIRPSDEPDCLLEWVELPSGNFALRNAREPKHVVFFTPNEWEAYLKGARSGEMSTDALRKRAESIA